jgi:ABC-type Fe3+ transport system substrate-binding protein
MTVVNRLLPTTITLPAGVETTLVGLPHARTNGGTRAVLSVESDIADVTTITIYYKLFASSNEVPYPTEFTIDASDNALMFIDGAECQGFAIIVKATNPTGGDLTVSWVVTS